MYSVVLMMAITTGSDSADFGRRGCNGCNGCQSSCHGAVSHGCSGSSCSSSCHGSCSGRRGLFGKHRRGCNGCHGSCHGTSCHGSSCHGSSCHGAVIIGGGCSGGHVVPHDGGGVIVDPKTKVMPKTKELPGTKDTAPKVKEVTGSTSATIVVTLPEDAKLSIDGALTNSTTGRRTFITPALDVDAEYVYTLRAEVVREGRPVVETQNVTVRGGQVSQVPFNFSSTSVVSR